VSERPMTRKVIAVEEPIADSLAREASKEQAGNPEDV